MTAKSTKPPAIPGPPWLKSQDPAFSENQSSHLKASKSSQKTNESKIPKEIIEGQKRLLAKRAMSAPAQAGPKISSSVVEEMELLKERLVKSGRWNPGPEIEAAPKAAPRKKLSRPGKGKKRSDFQDRYPKIFKNRSTWLVFDYVWRFAKKTKSNKLRWEGYMSIVAKDLKLSRWTVQRNFKRLEAAGIFTRWNTGKKFLRNIASGSGPAYHHTVVTVAWSPVWLTWQKRKARREKAKKKS